MLIAVYKYWYNADIRRKRSRRLRDAFYPLIAILAILLLITIGCKDDDENNVNLLLKYDSGSEMFGFATGNIENETWRSSCFFTPYSNDSTKTGIYFRTFENEVLLRESYTLGNLRFEPNYFILENGCNNGSSNYCVSTFIIKDDDGHIVGSRYSLDESKSNFLEVTEWNEDRQILKGKFGFSMTQDDPIDAAYPKAISITNGYFECTEYE